MTINFFLISFSFKGLEVGIEPTGQHKEVKDKKDLALLAEIENISARLDFRHYVRCYVMFTLTFYLLSVYIIDLHVLVTEVLIVLVEVILRCMLLISVNINIRRL